MKALKFFNSLFIKTFLSIIISFGFIILLYIYSLIQNQKESIYNTIYAQSKTIAKSIVLSSADAMLSHDYSYIVEYGLKLLEEHQELNYLIIHDKTGKIIYVNRQKWSILKTLPKEISALHTNRVEDRLLTSSLSEKRVFHMSYPLNFSEIKWGWVDIGFSLKEYNKSVEKIYQESLIILFIILFISTIFSYFFTKWLVKPIVSLTDASKELSLGNFDLAIPKVRNDEIGVLTDNFIKMVKKIEKYTKELKDAKNELENKVEIRTKELQKKTLELEKLNKELDKKIKEAIEKNREQERILVQQSRHAAMGEMIGNIAHQWRQPLNAVSLLLQNIEVAYEMNILDKEYIHKIVNKGNLITKSMSKTIDDFRNFFKPNKIKETFTLYEGYLSAKEIVGLNFENNNIHLKEQIDKEVSTFGYQNEFSQVILNILNNAKDALIENSIEKKEIQIKIFRKDDSNCIEISDNAGGIPNDIIEKIFDPYFSTKEEGKGTGIGLYMSKTIIESNMDGKLTVFNNKEGAVFKIVLYSLNEIEIP